MTQTLSTYPSGNKSWLFGPRSKDVTVSSVIEGLEKVQPPTYLYLYRYAV